MLFCPFTSRVAVVTARGCIPAAAAFATIEEYDLQARVGKELPPSAERRVWKPPTGDADRVTLAEPVEGVFETAKLIRPQPEYESTLDIVAGADRMLFSTVAEMCVQICGIVAEATLDLMLVLEVQKDTITAVLPTEEATVDFGAINAERTVTLVAPVTAWFNDCITTLGIRSAS